MCGLCVWAVCVWGGGRGCCGHRHCCPQPAGSRAPAPHCRHLPAVLHRTHCRRALFSLCSLTDTKDPPTPLTTLPLPAPAPCPRDTCLQAGATPLYAAVSGRQTELVRWLLSSEAALAAGASVDREKGAKVRAGRGGEGRGGRVLTVYCPSWCVLHGRER